MKGSNGAVRGFAVGWAAYVGLGGELEAEGIIEELGREENEEVASRL